jgi:hypothetical protein
MQQLLGIILFITSLPFYYVALTIMDVITYVREGRFMTTAEMQVFTERIAPINIKISTAFYVILFVYLKYIHQ